MIYCGKHVVVNLRVSYLIRLVSLPFTSLTLFIALDNLCVLLFKYFCPVYPEVHINLGFIPLHC